MRPAIAAWLRTSCLQTAPAIDSQQLRVIPAGKLADACWRNADSNLAKLDAKAAQLHLIVDATQTLNGSVR